MSVKKEEKQILLNVIDYIKGIYNKENSWSVETEKLITLLKIDRTEFYRQIYVLKDKIHFSHAVDIFNAKNIGDLITILEALAYKQAEYVFNEKTQQALHLKIQPGPILMSFFFVM